MYGTSESQLKTIEDLVLDFLIFRKHRQTLDNIEFRTEHDAYKAWHIYSSSLDHDDSLKTDSYCSPQDYDTQNFMDDSEESFEVVDMETDMEFMRQLFSEINKKLYSYVVEVINQNEYEGSPIYDEHINREYLAQLVDQVIEKAANSINEIEEINLEMERTYWGRNKLLRSSVESTVLHELYGHRRPKYRKFRHPHYKNHRGRYPHHNHNNHKH